MIPKDILANLYLELYQAKIKRGDRTVRLLLADCPPGQRGPSARLVGKRCISRHSGSNNRSSTRGRRTVRATRGLSAGVSQTVRACRALVGPRPRDEYQQPSSLSRPKTHTSLFLPLSQRKSSPPWNFSFKHSPDRPSTSPDTPRDSPPSHPGIFSNISFYFSDFEQEGDKGLEV
jgi:hypothetical protein